MPGRTVTFLVRGALVLVAIAFAPGRAGATPVRVLTPVPRADARARPPAVALPAPAGTRRAWRARRTPRLLWTGFRPMRDGSGVEVLLQTSAEVALAIRAEDARGVSFLLKHCRALRRTARLPLETRYFDSAVTRVAMKRRAADLEVAISLRQPVTPRTRKEAGPGGSWFWVLEFPGPANGAAPRTTTAHR